MNCPCCKKPLDGLDIDKSKHNDITVCVHCAAILVVKKKNLGFHLDYADEDLLNELEDLYPDSFIELQRYTAMIKQLNSDANATLN